MVGRITKGAQIYGVLEYNAQKVRDGEATVLYGNKVLGECEQSDSFDMQRAMLSFQPYFDKGYSIKDPVFHVSLNPDRRDNLTDDQLVAIAQEYMERMGFGEQPYYVFKHHDIDREHIHIVSVRIRDDGTTIPDSYERVRSTAILGDIERDYNLHPAIRGKEQAEFDRVKKVEYGHGNLKQQMKSTIRLLAQQYKFGSLTEYRTLLNLYNIDMEERKGEKNGRRYNGIVYTATDPAGVWKGTPMKSSALTPQGGYRALMARIEQSEPAIKSEQAKGPIRNTIAQAMHQTRTQVEFVARLKAQEIDAVFRQNSAGRITGVTFIDHRSKTVLNGSRLGKSYSANVFQELFNNPRADRDSLLPKLTAPKAHTPTPDKKAPAARATQSADTAKRPIIREPRPTVKIPSVPSGFSPMPSPAHVPDIVEAVGDMFEQLAEGGMTQDEFEAWRNNLSRKRKRRKKKGVRQ